MIYYVYLLNLLAVVYAQVTKLDDGITFPHLQSFDTRAALAQALQDYSGNPSSTNLDSLVFYLTDSKTYFAFAKAGPRSWHSSATNLLSRNKSTLSMIEIDLGDEAFDVGCNYFPIATFSAEFSSGQVKFDREITRTSKIAYNPVITQDLSIIIVGFKVTLGIDVEVARTKKLAISCSAKPGGRVQLQANNRMFHFPFARVRKVEFIGETKTFQNSSWEHVKSSVFGEKYSGALFSSAFDLGNYRCVTQESKFELTTGRKWIEYSLPLSI